MCYLNLARRRFFPIGITMLVNELVAHNHDVRIFDTSFYNEISVDLDEKRRKLGFYKSIENEIPIKLKETNPLEDLKKFIKEFNPGLVGFSALSIDFPLAKTFAKMVKETNQTIITVLGGVHATVASEECILEDCFDILCIGEGEHALTELAKAVEEGNDYSHIDNLWVKNEKKIEKNKVRSYKDMDKLPKPDWDLFDSQHIWGALYGKMYRMAPVELSRGCPYRCTYCVNDRLRNIYDDGVNYHRRKTPEKAIEDMWYLKNKYNIEMFYILDETFLAMKNTELQKLSELYRLKIHTPFFSQTRPETVTEEKARIIAEMGCKVISMGIENGNEEIRRTVLNRNVSNEQIIKAFKTMHKYGIKVSSFNMLGVPGETKKTVLETIELNRLCEADSIGVSYFFPYKGTSLRNFAIKENMITGNEDPGLANYQPVLNLPTITKEDIIHFYTHFVEYCKSKQGNE